MKPHEYKMVYYLTARGLGKAASETTLVTLLGVMEWAQFDTHADVTLLP